MTYPSRSRQRHSALLLMLIATLGGCATTSPNGRLSPAVDAYNEGDFDEARQRAASVMLSTSGSQQQEAAYVAGLAAYRLGDLDEADRRLSRATRSSDSETSAPAEAMLGMVRLRQNRPRDAAALLTTAAQGLSGADRVNAERLGADARARAGGYSAAATMYDAAAATSMRRAQAGDSRLVGFALQVGAFEEEQRARSAAGEARSIADQHQLSGPWVVPGTDSRGRRLYLVQLGHFPSRQAANQARQSLGRLDLIVTTRTQ